MDIASAFVASLQLSTARGCTFTPGCALDHKAGKALKTLRKRQTQAVIKPAHVSERESTKKGEGIRQLSSPGQRFYDFSNHKIEAIRLTHCRVISEELATIVYDKVRKKQSTLEDMAFMVSTLDDTRVNRGDTGWYYLDGGNTFELDEDLVKLAVKARPGALQKVRIGDVWEVYVVSDVRHGVSASMLGRRRGGFAVNGNMKRNMKKPKIDSDSYYIETFGCQMNASDSERMGAELERHGYHSTDKPKESSIYILNTCALRDHAEQKVYSYLGPQAQRKWDAPEEVTLMVTGCVAQQEGEKLLARVPEVDIVMGPQYANRIGEVLNEFKERQAQVVAVDPIHIQEDISRPKRGSKVTAWVNVIYGCLERCTYCVVPNTRGLEQSRSIEGIVGEVEDLATEGYKEVVLLGQNVDAYGRDLYPKVTLSDLLRRVHEVEGIERIRFTTGHPRYISDNLIETVYELPKVMEHFHIPPQSGDTQVLREMKRGYTRERYIAIAKRIRQKIPDASICADMIVGFPGETEEAFQNSVSMADEVVFDANMVRAYSARPNTQAGLRVDQVEEAVKMERLHVMNRKMREQAEQRSRRYMGRVVEVLVEGCNEKREGEMMGRERTNRVVFFEGSMEVVGKVVEVEVDECYAFSLRGRLRRVVSG